MRSSICSSNDTSVNDSVMSDEMACSNPPIANSHSSMTDIIQEVQSLYIGRMERLKADVTNQRQIQDQNILLRQWIDDLWEQNIILVDTLKELEHESEKRSSLLESAVNSPCTLCNEYKSYFETGLNQTVQSYEQEMRTLTSTGTKLMKENSEISQQLSISNSRLASAESEVVFLQNELKRYHSLEKKDEEVGDLQLAEQTSDLQESPSWTSECYQNLQEETEVLQSDSIDQSPASSVVLSARSTSKLLQRCNELIKERDTAIEQLKQLRQLQENSCAGQNMPEITAATSELSNGHSVPQCHKVCIMKPPLTNGLHSINNAATQVIQTTTHDIWCQTQQLTDASEGSESGTNSKSARFSGNAQLQIEAQNQLEENQLLISDLQKHLSSARDEITLKDCTLSRLEAKLAACRYQLIAMEAQQEQKSQKMAELEQENQELEEKIFELESKLEESCVESQRLQEESNSQLVKITDLQQRILAEETHTKQLTNKCIEKDVEIGQQWGTINLLKLSVTEAKQKIQVLEASSSSSFLGSLLGSSSRTDASVRLSARSVHNV